ncbi:MAG: aspartate kinase [Salinivirgaceae bacterium]|nr:aspartate kinase [Salinivirgaceae bacterium]
MRDKKSTLPLKKAMQNIKINKFGGASVRSAKAIRDLLAIIKSIDGKQVVVVSAMGKTTNKLELLTKLWFDGNSDYISIFNEIKNDHLAISAELFGEKHDEIEHTFDALFELLQKPSSLDYNYEYDKIVSFGEILSTKIVAKYLSSQLNNVTWLDIRTILKTDQIFREASVDWELSAKMTSKTISFATTDIYVTQGFIGSTKSNLTTTLGREGSDYTAAALAWLLNSESVTVWKDVPGIMNADPKWLENPTKIDKLSYAETVELSYYGAKVIHPKTLRPLQQKGIPLYVKSFLNPTLQGTEINNLHHKHNTPFYIRKENQVLVTLYPQDFSFMEHHNIQLIQGILSEYRLQVNLIQMSALSFSFCFDQSPQIWDALKDALSNLFRLKFNTCTELITIRHYNEDAIERVTNNTKVFLEQKTRKTVQFVLEAKR